MNSPVSSRSFGLASYTVAATAFATLFSVSDAQGEVITYDNGGAGWTSINTSGTLVSLNMDGDVRLDGTQPDNAQFDFHYSITPIGETGTTSEKLKVSASGGPGTSTSLTPMVGSLPLAPGSTIGSSVNAPTAPGATLLGGGGKTGGATWVPGQRAYLGLGFENNGARHYGWADITVHNLQSLTLHGYGYESVAGMDVVTPVPEPAVSTLMMAAGAGGVLALRRRRKNNNKAVATN